jgi:hypothetical protein
MNNEDLIRALREALAELRRLRYLHTRYEGKAGEVDLTAITQAHEALRKRGIPASDGFGKMIA